MIFVTVGTHQQGFDRLIEALGGLPGPELVVQYGYSQAPAGVAESAPFMPFDEIRSRLESADVVVTHAGVGSILGARRAGHVPVVVPRYHDRGEHVDDHQIELTRTLADNGTVLPVWDTAQLAEVVRSAPPRGAAQASDASSLAAAIRTALAAPR